MPEMYSGYDEMAAVAEMPLGQDVHEHINQIVQIDQEIIHLNKRRRQLQEKVEKAMNEVQKHYNDVVHGPQEAPGY